jgi:hypothetical protein
MSVEKYSTQLNYEAFYIGNAITYLEKHLEDLTNNPQEGSESRFLVDRIIKHLKFGTIGGRVFSMEEDYRKHEAGVAEAWKEFREEHPEYFK